MVELSATSSGYATLTPDEVHYKMCKKIAQLTKVIFHLNSKNEENERLVQAHTKTYEREVDALTIEYNTRVKTLRDLVKQTKIKEENLVGEVDDAKAAARKEKEKAAERVECLEEEFTRACKGQEEAFENELANVLSRVRVTQSENEKERAMLMNSINELKHQHVAEAEASRKAHERQLSLVNSQLETAKEEGEKQLTLKREAHTKELKTLSENHRVALINAENILKEQAEKAEKKLRSEMFGMEERVEALRGELAKREKDLEVLRSVLEDSRRQLSDFESELSNKDAKVVEHERELLELQKMVDQKDAFLREKQGEIEQLEGEKTRLSSALQKRDCELAQKASNAGAVTEALREAEARVKERDDALADASAENARLKSDLSGLRGELRSSQERTKRETELLENELHLAKAHATRLDTEWQKKVETAVANSKAEIDELKRGHREEMEQTSRNFETEIAELRKARHDSEVRLAEFQKAALHSKEEAYELEKNRMERDHEAKLEQATRRHQDELAKAESRSEEWKAEKERLGECLEKVERRKRDLESTVSNLEERLLNKNSELDREAAAHRSAVEGLMKQFEAEMERRLRAAEETLLKSEQMKRSEALSEKEKRVDELNSKIGLLMAELNTIGNESAKEKLRMEGVLEATRKGAQERVEILEGQMAERLSSMEEEMESERERWKEKEEKLLGDFNARMGRLEAEHRQKLEETRDGVTKKWEEARAADRARFSRELEQKQARHEAAVRCLKAEHQTEAKTLRDEMQKARRTLESRVEEAQESKKKKEDELNRKLDEAKHALLEQDRKINIQGQEITEKNLALDHLSSRLAHETAILRKQLEREVEEHRQKMQLASERQRGEIRALTNEHKQVIEDRDKLAQQVEEGYTEKIIGLDNRIGELIRMYENRPSRDEDVIKIDHLEKELRQMNHAYEDLKERMKVYKLELINREQNYNKVFSANPIIGVYSPLKDSQVIPGSLGGNAVQRKPSAKGLRKTLGRKAATTDV